MYPIAVGGSPFKVKGVVYGNVLRYIEKSVASGLAGFVDGLPDEPLRAFLLQQFLVGGWYDVLPLHDVVAQLSKALGITFREASNRLGIVAASTDLPTLYRFLLKLASPAMVVDRFPRSSKTYFNFVDLSVERLDDHHYAIHQRGIPRAVSALYQYAVEAFRHRALELSGARDPKSRWGAFDADGTREGVELVRARCELSWT